jgi:hypothetical protein
MPLVIASKYKPVPPTRIGVFLFFIHSLIFFLTKASHTPVEKCFLADLAPLSFYKKKQTGLANCLAGCAHTHF